MGLHPVKSVSVSSSWMDEKICMTRRELVMINVVMSKNVGMGRIDFLVRIEGVDSWGFYF